MKEENPEHIRRDVLKKLNRIVFGVFAPILAAAALLFMFFAPPVFQIDGTYCLAGSGEGSELRENGGSVLAGPGLVRIWGKYPWLFGTTGDPARPFFILNFGKKEFRAFSGAETAKPGNEFEVFLKRNGFSTEQCLSWDDLYRRPDGKKHRQQLKKLLERPSKGKKFLFF